MAFEQRRQHLPPLRREAQVLAFADRLGMTQRLRLATGVVVFAMFEDRADMSHERVSTTCSGVHCNI